MLRKLLLSLFIIITPFLFGFSPYNEILKHEDNKIEKIINFETQSDKNNMNNLEIILSSNNLYFNFKNSEIKEILKNNKEKLIEEANKYLNQKDYVSVNKLLNTAQKYYEEDQTINNLIQLNNQMMELNNYVEYNGKIEHLTFNTLISFPEKAFTNNLGNTYNEEKLTTSEFTAILNELYKNNYIIVDIFDIINTDNSITPKKLLLPPNKKPIILSFDNVTYKSNYQNIGEVDKIIIDRNNNIATYTTKKSIQDRIQYDNEFIVILENFIKSHPDFSHNNARGIIFLTGENGIMGYNTTHKNASNKYEAKRVSEVIKKLKSLGWRFGCNNYSYKDENTKSDMEFAKELSLWNNEIRTIIGNTTLYAHPYNTPNDESKIELLLTNNFKIFFTNDHECNIKFSGDMCTMSRRKITAQVLRTSNGALSHLFNCEKVYDHSNRPISFYED